VELGVQILMISHHPEHHFPMLPHRLHLFKQDHMIQAAWSTNGTAPVWDPDQEGIRSITLEHFQSHTHTHIPLSPHVTLLSGQNNLGKSSILQALRCVFLNEGEESFIQHHQPSTKITLDFGPEHHLTWERFRKGKTIEHYKLIDPTQPSQPLHSSPVATIPEWVFEHTHIGLIHGFDVQLRHQKKPVFLLDESASTRAKVLAVGSDTTYVQTMINLDKQDLQEARSSIKWGEKHLEQVNRQIQCFEPMYATQANFEQLHDLIGQHDQTQQQHRQHQQWYQQWLYSTHTFNALSWAQTDVFPSWPELKPLEWIAPYLNRWKEAQARIDVLETAIVKDFPDLVWPQYNETQASCLLHWKEQQHTIQTLYQHLSHPWTPYPELKSSGEHRAWFEHWASQQQSIQTLSALLETPFPDLSLVSPMERPELPWKEWTQQVQRLQLELKATDDELNALPTDQLQCPTCHQWVDPKTHLDNPHESISLSPNP